MPETEFQVFVCNSCNLVYNLNRLEEVKRNQLHCLSLILKCVCIVKELTLRNK